MQFSIDPTSQAIQWFPWWEASNWVSRRTILGEDSTAAPDSLPTWKGGPLDIGKHQGDHTRKVGGIFSIWTTKKTWICLVGDFFIVVNHHYSPPFGRNMFGSLFPSIEEANQGLLIDPIFSRMWDFMFLCLKEVPSTWRIIPVSKWLVTRIYKPWKGHLEGNNPT